MRKAITETRGIIVDHPHLSVHSFERRPSWRARFIGRKQGLAALAASFAVALSGCTVPAPAEDLAGSAAEAETVATSSAPETSPTSAPETTTATPPPSPAPTQSAEESASAGTALALLETIEIKGRAPKTGYDRDNFGSGWTDIDHNGCDTRIICTARGL